MSDDTFNKFFEVLNLSKDKWKEVPSSVQDRIFSSDLVGMSDVKLLNLWTEFYLNNCEGSGYSTRGWYHELYKPLAALGGQWLDIGSGLGFDGVFFAENGANITFVDIVDDNLQVIKRICDIKGLKSVKFILLNDIQIINTLPQFDVITAIGSLIHAPYTLMSEERKALASHLLPNGRWLELCYPKERWVREGKLDFNDWGKKTDGARTPWAEWYDLNKLLESLRPYEFDVILNMNFHGDDFNWFDLIKKD